MLKTYLKDVAYLTEGFDYVIEILDLYINSKFYTNGQKKFLKEFKDKVLNIMDKNKNLVI